MVDQDEEEEEPVAQVFSPQKQERVDKVVRESFSSEEEINHLVVASKEQSVQEEESPEKAQEAQEEVNGPNEEADDEQEKSLDNETDNESVFDPFLEAQKIAMMLKAECMAELPFTIPKLDLEQAFSPNEKNTQRTHRDQQNEQTILTDRSNKLAKSNTKTEKRAHRKNLSSNPDLVLVNQFHHESIKVNQFNDFDEDHVSNDAFNKLLEKTEKKIQQHITEEDSPTQVLPATIFENLESTQNRESEHSSDECMQEIVSPFRGLAKLQEADESETNWQINPIKIKRKDAIEESPERTLGNAFDNYVDEDANQGYNYENSNQGSPCESP